MEHLVARANKSTLPLHVIASAEYKRWLRAQSKVAQNWLKSAGCSGKDGAVHVFPGASGTPAGAVLVADDPTPWTFARAAHKLAHGKFRLHAEQTLEQANDAALGWALAGYKYERYKTKSTPLPTLVWPQQADRAVVGALVDAIALGRDLITTPAEDMGPAQLVQAGVELANAHGARTKVIVGDNLLKKNFPAVHAVGRAAGPSAAPRLLDLTWGNPKAPKVTLVGKGVCFDSGGLDLKSAAGMKLMKKDMGGAATALALASVVMQTELPVRLRVLIPAVENAVSGNALRPGDVIATRRGHTVEVNNTDAEGRLILSDALAEACSEQPELLIDFATLTGAARVALGTELPALFSNDDAFADEVLACGLAQHDQLWRLPLFDPYRRHLESTVANLSNVSNVGPGGAITAALFLREFVDPEISWTHVDTMAYFTSSRPGRPAGGEVFGVRAFYAALAQRYA